MNDHRYDLSEEEAAELAAKVAAGALALDDAEPGWYWKLDFNTLDMTHGWQCVLGQLYGVFSHGLKDLKWSEEKADEMGVYIHNSADMPHNEWIARYAELQECWIGEAADRLSTRLLNSL
ncbi:hypothetical protein GCM10010149_87870 [Nonomuraea roseoviolacea subsp. roseoviolacea]|uniref:hypothetical protein n=1 Tax=Nonomuraea roseoviolacea TaxID=103837 RepID=UPI0031E39636